MRRSNSKTVYGNVSEGCSPSDPTGRPNKDENGDIGEQYLPHSQGFASRLYLAVGHGVLLSNCATFLMGNDLSSATNLPKRAPTSCKRRACAQPVPASARIQPDCALIHQELKRKGVTLQLLWDEYVDAHGRQATYRYTQFCQRYHEFRARSVQLMKS